ncbi:hypothetical protein [Methylomonas sp. AM2-LC]|uniref:hypothetical protein n=1 Tax=Methylomonas sp. AM2-LC TaxID=3153301 RepID=UPI003266C219
MSEEVFIQVQAFKLQHSHHHENCGYVTESQVNIIVKLNDTEIPALTIGTWGNAALYSFMANPDDFVDIYIDPKDRSLYNIEGNFVYKGQGRFDRNIKYSRQDQCAMFAMPEGIDLLGSGAPRFILNLFRGFVTPFRLVNEQVKNIIHDVYPSLDDVFETLEEPEDIYFLKPQPIDQTARAPDYERRTVDPAANVRCFRLSKPFASVPGVVFVSMPKDIPVKIFDESTPGLSYLIMIHPFLGPYYNNDRYPTGLKHLWDVGLKYMGFQSFNPIISRYANGTGSNHTKLDSSREDMGLPHQAAAAGKKMAVVMPMNYGNSIGNFLSGQFAHSLLHDFYAWEMRAQEYYFDPDNIGPCAISGFSSGNGILADFLNHNAGDHFCNNLITELYSIDPPDLTHVLDQIVDAAESWKNRGIADKKFRIYTQLPFHDKLKHFNSPHQPWPHAPFAMENPDGHTMVSISAGAFSRAAAALDPEFKSRYQQGYTGGDGDAHRLLCQSALTDALRRSQFPDL